MRVQCLIDGYNLLHVTGALGTSADGAALERARFAMLRKLASWFEPPQRQRVLVVFDAGTSPPAEDPPASDDQVRVRFARGYEDADALIEELIRRHPTPRRLHVVSGDRRIQRAAAARRAGCSSSEAWWQQMLRQQPQPERPSEKPESPDSDEAAHWLRIFGGS